MPLLQELMKKVKNQPRPAKGKASVKTLAQFLENQEKKGIERKKKRIEKTYKKAKKNIVKATPSSKKKKSPVVLELTKAQKALHKKVYGPKKTAYKSPTPSPKSVKSSSPKSAKSALSNTVNYN